MITDAYLIPCKRAEIAATDLQRDMTEGADLEWYTFRVASNETAERGDLIFSPDNQRGAVAFGADAEWTDASNAVDVLLRWLHGRMVN